MERCKRCGCFYVSPTNVCANCEASDNSDKAKLNNFYQTNTDYSFENMIYQTGIAPSNLTRFLQMPEYSKYIKQTKQKGVEDYE